MIRYSKPAVENETQLVFGRALHPLTTRSGMVLGGGVVYPEINFTLPPMIVHASTMPEVLRQYGEMIEGVLKRAAELEVPGIVVELETLPPMTENPKWGRDVCRVLIDALGEYAGRNGLLSTLRITPNDTREMVRPPRMRSGPLLEGMMELFELCASDGAELLSIESVGGKEVHDLALQMGDMGQVVFALCVMGVRDMEFLWARIVKVAKAHGAVPAGDTACGFANTAMVLAEQRMIPRVLAAVVRCISAVRSLVAYQCGAVGPGKDCGYENVILKAITGFPMAMEGKSSSCAHFSPVGNVAAAACDAWSNESVQNVRLLAGPAPTCSLEQLAYDCRLMNQALGDGEAGVRTLKRWLCESDAPLDPQAFVLTPAAAVEIARAIVAAPNAYRAGVAAGLKAIDLLDSALADGRLRVAEREKPWLPRMRNELEALPEDESRFVRNTLPNLDSTTYRAQDYDLE